MLEYEDLSTTPDDGRRYELVRGALLVTPSPTLLHQRVSKRLYSVLVDYFEGRSIGEVFFAPLDVILTNRDVFVPDLVVVTESGRLSQRGVEGPPALVVEILSLSTRRQDRGVKARRYAALGVSHYWIVDPEARRIECYRSADGVFRSRVEGQGDSMVAHPDWDGLAIDLAGLWR